MHRRSRRSGRTNGRGGRTGREVLRRRGRRDRACRVWRPFAVGAAPAPSAVTPVLVPFAAAEAGPDDNDVSEWTPGFHGESAKLVRASSARRRRRMHVFYYRTKSRVGTRDLRESIVSSGRSVGVRLNFDLWRSASAASRGSAADRHRRPAPNHLVAYSLYWVDGTLTSNDYVRRHASRVALAVVRAMPRLSCSSRR